MCVEVSVKPPYPTPHSRPWGVCLHKADAVPRNKGVNQHIDDEVILLFQLLLQIAPRNKGVNQHVDDEVFSSSSSSSSSSCFSSSFPSEERSLLFFIARFSLSHCVGYSLLISGVFHVLLATEPSRQLGVLDGNSQRPFLKIYTE